jgi:hypothetical protein
VFAFNCNIGGTQNPLGVKWTGASGLPTDVNGEGSGFELLLQDSTENDHIVAARELGFDLLLVVLRKSLWVGTPSGQTARPVDFRPRVPGTGAVSEPTVRTVEGGVMFLSDNGVKFFDGNAAVHKSGAIDSDLLPIDYVNLQRYSATYNAALQRYILHTPTTTWIYELLYDRWLRSSAVINRSLGIFNPFTQNYSSLAAGWGDTWNGFWGDEPVGGITALFDDILYLKGAQLGGPDSTITTYFGVAQVTIWQSPRADGASIESVIEYDRFDFEYEGAAVVNIYVPDGAGDLLRLFKSHTLATATARRHSKAYATTVSGLGLGCKLMFSSSVGLKLRRLSARFCPRSERITTP